MRALIQRVTAAGVYIDGELERRIGPGLVILLGVASTDALEDLNYLADKVTQLRIFNDGEGKMNRSLTDAGGQALVVSQFTLYGDTSKGRRPGFSQAAPPELAEPMYEAFADAVPDISLAPRAGRPGLVVLRSFVAV